MNFSELLNQLILRLECSGKELSEASALSPAVISRYRSGARTPAADSDALQALLQGLSLLAEQRGVALPELSELQKLCELPDLTDCDLLAEHLDQLITELGISTSQLARAVNYDASYLSRIRTKQRRPSDPAAFAEAVCRFAARNVDSSAGIAALAALTGQPAPELADEAARCAVLRRWLFHGSTERKDELGHFLDRLDSFDLNDYIRSIHFDTLKVPSLPFRLPAAKSYVGLEEMKAGELDFFRSTVLSRADEPVFMCSDMDMADLAEDTDFGKKWMFAIALCIKKGLHLDIIHTLDRPFGELMLGLESWIPIYMTGQVSPFYFKNPGNSLYQHLHYVSGAAALTGACIAGHHAEGRYQLTKRTEDLAYYRRNADFMLKKALPLMDVFRSPRAAELQLLLREDSTREGVRRDLLSVPPICTLSEPQLRRILRENAVSAERAAEILRYAALQQELAEAILAHSPIHDELPRLTREEFEEHPVYLALEGCFPETGLAYSYETYQAHLAETEAFAAAHKRYTVRLTRRRAFRNIQIYTHEGQFALISKSNAPVVHFVIRQPKLLSAIEQLRIPFEEP